MLLVSFLLVIVATILLLSGLFLTQDLTLIFTSIACSALAGLVLVVAVLRSRPRPAATAVGYDDIPAVHGPATDASAPALEETRTPAREFPIPDYDTLEVVEVLPLLGDLAPADLDMVRQREASGRAHPWILARIDALLESETPTGEVEWAPKEWGAEEAEEEDAAAGGWRDDESEWAQRRSAPDWAASDFPLESGSDYDEIAVIREFPIDGYDSLRANEILPRLAGLGSEDLKMVREEEAAGKARTSILSRIDVLLARDLPTVDRASGRTIPGKAAKPPARAAKVSKAAATLPIEGYDGLTVAQVTARLSGLSLAELKAVRNYERRHKNRLGVLQKIDGAIIRAGGR